MYVEGYCVLRPTFARLLKCKPDGIVGENVWAVNHRLVSVHLRILSDISNIAKIYLNLGKRKYGYYTMV